MEHRIFKIKKKVKHQKIGGKKFIVDEYITQTLSREEVYRQALNGNFACMNFIQRRSDFDFALNFPYKLYYGHVENLGYIIAEDEIENI